MYKFLFTITMLCGVLVTTPVLSDDIVAGEQKAENCVGCHGVKGQSNNGQWPNLAGQQKAYLLMQLKAFKSGSRSNSVMQAMVASLSDTDMINLAAYFASIPVTNKSQELATVKPGQAKANVCLGCHGQNAAGNGQIPRLAGQHAEYLATQLTNFKQGFRKSGPMQAIASNLSDTDIKDLVEYFSGL